MISPWSLQGSISHQYSEHGSVIKFINELFNLVPLAQLPDEAHARSLGQANLGQANLGPSDDPANELGDLTEAFDYTRMQNNTPILPVGRDVLADADQDAAASGDGDLRRRTATPTAPARRSAILPTDFPSAAAYQAGQPTDPYPVDVNPRPSQSPGTPTSGTWTP